MIPNSDYIINESNNLLHFRESSNELLVATITEGNYTSSELVSEIQTQLNNAGNSGYTVVTNNYKSLTENDPSRVDQNFGNGENVFDGDYDSFWISNTNNGFIIYDFQTKQTVQK